MFDFKELNPELITTKQLSLLTGVHISTILRKLKSKGLVPIKINLGLNGMYLWNEKNAREALGLPPKD